MTNSDTKPEVMFLDYVKDGQCRLLVHWDIKEVTKEDPITGETRTSWDYSERVIWWILPQKYETLDEILKYLDEIGTEILNWAMATDLNYDGTVSKESAKEFAASKSELLKQ